MGVDLVELIFFKTQEFILNCALIILVMFDPPITSGANIFIIIAICLIAAGAAVAVLDVYKNTLPKKNKPEKE